MKCKLVLFIIMLIPSLAWCHKSSDSFINLSIQENNIVGRWDIALRDLEYALALDVNSDGAITWSELNTRFQEIEHYAFSRFQVEHGSQQCVQKTGLLQVDQHSDGAYAVINFDLDCNQVVDQLSVDYQLFFELDPTHRGLLQITQKDISKFIVFSPENPHSDIVLSESNYWQTFQQFFKEGIWHIWQGYDHILFLLCLLLPSLINRKDTNWVVNDHISNTLKQMGKIVTAFTVAHSITLLLAVLQLVSLPSRWVESAIAFSVIVVAINNLYPFFRERAWFFAFAFGLIHGFGFASVLTNLNLTSSNIGVSLLGFNVGVEIGQLAIVSVFVSLALLLRKQGFYRQVIFNLGSLSILSLALFWFIERSFDLNIPIV